MRRRTERQDHNGDAAPRSTAREIRHASTIRRSATNSIRPGCRGLFTPRDQRRRQIWSAYQAIKHIRYGPDWRQTSSRRRRSSSPTSHGNLRTVSWITPTCENSDHAGCGSNTGPAWVASLVNAIGKSKYWNSTAIFIMWDDYGGWYDHVRAAVRRLRRSRHALAAAGRFAICQERYVSHVQYEHGSILRFVEDQFGLPRLTASDSRATSPKPTASTSRKLRGDTKPSSQTRIRTSSCVSLPITGRPTRSKTRHGR